MVEGARLESVYTVKGIVGSNPTLSAIIKIFIDFDKKILIIGEVKFYLINFKKEKNYGVDYTGRDSWCSILYESIRMFNTVRIKP